MSIINNPVLIVHNNGSYVNDESVVSLLFAPENNETG